MNRDRLKLSAVAALFLAAATLTVASAWASDPNPPGSPRYELCPDDCNDGVKRYNPGCEWYHNAWRCLDMLGDPKDQCPADQSSSRL